MKRNSTGWPIYLIFVIIFSTFLSAQVDTAWVRRYNGPGDSIDIAYAIAVDSAGNVYVAGGSTGIGSSLDFTTIKYYPNGDTVWVRRYSGPGSSYDEIVAMELDYDGYVYITGKSSDEGYSSDYATIKYQPNGDVVWERRYGWNNSRELVADLAVDLSGNVYITGSSDLSGSSDFVTIKYNSNGSQEWIRFYRYPGHYDRAFALAVDSTDYVYVAGTSENIGTNADLTTIKYRSNGDSVWIRSLNGSSNGNDEAHAIEVCPNGNIVVGGIVRGTNSNYDYAVVKYFPSGETAWVRTYNGPGNGEDRLTSLAIDDSDNVYVTGLSIGSSSSYDCATIKYNTHGDPIWVRRYCGPDSSYDVAYAIAVDDERNVYVTGTCNGNNTGTAFDYVTIKYSPNGDAAWVQIYNGPSNLWDVAQAMAVDNMGNVYVTGGSIGLSSYSDFTTIKYTQVEQVDEHHCILASVKQQIDIFPNPCHKVTSISIGQGAGGKELKIYDISGRLIARHAPCIMPYTLDLTGLAPGVYFVQVDGIRAVGKIVITK